jgi:Putative adhesin
MSEWADAQFERKLSVTGPAAVDVVIRSGSVRVRRGEDGSITVRGTLRARDSVFDWVDPDARVQRLAADPPVIQDGNHISIGSGADPWLLRRVKCQLEIEAPGDTSIRAVGDSADVFIEGVGGPVDCETDSGDIEIQDVRSQISASSDSGDISIRKVAGTVEARTDSGEIVALEIGGGIDVRSDSGEIELSQTAVGPVYVRTDSGGVRLRLVESGGYEIRVRTDNGSVELPEMSGARGSRRRLEGLVRGGGSIVDIETDSGDIQVR